MNTARILDIIGYQATESDSKRLEFAVSKFGGRYGASTAALSKAGSIRGSEVSIGTSYFGAENAHALEKKIEQLGYGVPQLDNDLQKLQREIHSMVSSFGEL